MSDDHKHTGSVYLRCSACQTFGVPMPDDETCGNCGNAFQNVRYLPPCCVAALRADLARLRAVADAARKLAASRASYRLHTSDCKLDWNDEPCNCALPELRIALVALDRALSPPPVSAGALLPERWAWMRPSSEHAEGPFATERLAFEDASRELGPGRPVIVGRCEAFDPAQWTGAIGLDDVVERMESMAEDNGWMIDDSVIDVSDGAREALSAALDAWARRYLTSTYWQLSDAPLSTTIALPEPEEP